MVWVHRQWNSDDPAQVSGGENGCSARADTLISLFDYAAQMHVGIAPAYDSCADGRESMQENEMPKPGGTMNMSTIAMIITTLVMLAGGQVLFKQASASISFSRPETLVSWTLFIALAVYGLATLLWLAVLARVPLSQAFIFYGLSFLLVPLFAWVFLGEAIPARVWVGSVVIAVGIVIASWDF